MGVLTAHFYNIFYCTLKSAFSSMGLNTEEADLAVPLQLTPSLEQYVCKRNARIKFD